MTEQAEIDPNMPPLDEIEPKAEQPIEEGKTDAAPVDEQESQFVNDVSEKTQKRINKITAEKYAEKRRADETERQLKELQQAQTVSQPNQQGQEPKLEDFDYDETAHTAALIDFKVNLKAEQIQQQQAQARSQQESQQRADGFNLKVAEFSQKVTDYEQVVANVPQLPPETLDAIMQNEKGVEIAYFLGKHLDVADEIATASPMAAAMKLGQISAQLTAIPKTVTSAAPDPINPVGSGGVSDKDESEMSMEEIYNM